MTPEKLKDWNLIAIHGATHEVEEMARIAVPELCEEVDSLNEEIRRLKETVATERANSRKLSARRQELEDMIATPRHFRM